MDSLFDSLLTGNVLDALDTHELIALWTADSATHHRLGHSALDPVSQAGLARVDQMFAVVSRIRVWESRADTFCKADCACVRLFLPFAFL